MSKVGKAGAKAGVGRRRLLGGIGASGLAAAVAVFGRSSPAMAGYTYGCCVLTFPNNMTLSACKVDPYYVWHCWHAGYVRCECCEKKERDLGWTIGSAYRCQ